jgi:hypothetical protein
MQCGYAANASALTAEDYEIYSLMITEALHGNDSFVVVDAQAGGVFDSRSVDEQVADVLAELKSEWCGDSIPELAQKQKIKSNQVDGLPKELFAAYVQEQNEIVELERRLTLSIPYEVLSGRDIHSDSKELKELDVRYPEWRWSVVGVGRIGYDDAHRYALGSVGYHLVGTWIMLFEKMDNGWNLARSCRTSIS